MLQGLAGLLAISIDMAKVTSLIYSVVIGVSLLSLL